MEFYRALDAANCWIPYFASFLYSTTSNQVSCRFRVEFNSDRVNFPVVGFAAHALAAICYFTASVILIYSLTVDEENPLFQPKDR